MGTHEWLMPLIGGTLIGAASAAMMYFHGRIAGISGIVGGLLAHVRGDMAWRLLFIAGLLSGGLLLLIAHPAVFPTESIRSPLALVVGGLLVGFGTRYGSGCTSGHGVCGLGRFSIRSIVATITFISTGALTVLIMRLAQGG